MQKSQGKPVSNVDGPIQRQWCQERIMDPQPKEKEAYNSIDFQAPRNTEP